MKVIVRGKVIALNDFIKKFKVSHTTTLKAHHKGLEQNEANTYKRKRRQEIMKLRAEINIFETEQYGEKNHNTTKIWFFQEINKIDNPLAKHTKRQRDGTQI